MLETTNSVTINRPREDVFAYLADGTNDLEWRPGVLDIARVKGDGSGVGAIYRQGVKGPFGRRVAADYEVVDWEPPERIGFRTVAGPVRPKGSYELIEAEGATKLTMTLRCSPSGLARLMKAGIRRSMESEVAALANLKRVLES
jgi:uncharacterized protein YndB with AHSA1/START domain